MADSSRSAWIRISPILSPARRCSLESPICFRTTPNPFNPYTSIRFEAGGTGHDTVAVYDLTGREVRTLLNGNGGEEEHVVPWDGKDSNGRTAPSRSYFYRLIGPDFPTPDSHTGEISRPRFFPFEGRSWIDDSAGASRQPNLAALFPRSARSNVRIG